MSIHIPQSMNMKGMSRRFMAWTCVSLAVLLLSPMLSATQAKAKEMSKASGGFIDFNLYPYSKIENDSVFTINAFAKLPNRFSYFSLTNFYNQSDREELTDTENFYTEQNLRWALPRNIPFDLTVQWNLRSGKDNDRLRLGARWKMHQTPFFNKLLKAINMTYTINFHFQFDHTDDTIWQMEHVYRINVLPDLLDNRVYIGGFGDHTFGGPDDPALVTENQLGVRLVDNLHAVAEYRRNEYRKGKENGLGIGLEYIVKF